MAKLAAELGLRVPRVDLVRQEGRAFVVSHWLDQLEASRDKLLQAGSEELAKLYLVAAVWGMRISAGRLQ